MTTDSRKAVLLVNLGSPDSTRVADVRRYLGEFLMDPCVIDVPYLVRKLIVGGFILPFRPKKSAAAYASIWWYEGSPLIVISRRLRDLVSARLDVADVPVELAMRYGNPSIPAAVERLKAKGIEEVFVVPLYPHYAMSTIGSTVKAVEDAVRRSDASMKLDVIRPFYDEPHYVEALAESARPYVEEGFDHLLVSYHGLPERHLRKTDPSGGHCLNVPECCNVESPSHRFCYRHQVLRTTEAFTARLGIPRDRYTLSFQSRLGKDAWLKPFTIEEARRLGATGVGRLLVMCPAFVSDCLETLEEIGMGVKEAFLEAGGKSFQLVPCLNDNPMWIDTLATYCRQGLGLARAADRRAQGA